MKHSIPNRVLFLLLTMLCTLRVVAQQQPQYSQFMFSNLLINPAYAGSDGALSLTLINRNQWTGVDGAPSTQSFGAHTKIHDKNIGLGLTVMHDKIGVHTNLSARTSYAYHIQLNQSTSLSFGLQVGLTSIKSDYASIAGNSNDPKLINSINETLVDFGSGILFKNQDLEVGISVPQLLNKTLELNDSLSTEIQRINFLGYGRYRLRLSDKLKLEPGVLIKYFSDTPISYDLNLNLLYKEVLTTGLSYRKEESIDLILKFQITQQLQLGYAYDYPLKTAALLSDASHEIMVHFLFRNMRKGISSPR